MLGAIGTKEIDDVILFEVSNEKILNYRDFARANSVRFAKHDVLINKPISEYVGEELDSISFSIDLLAGFGVDPVVEMNKLVVLQRAGTPISVFVGEMAFGRYMWVIKELNMAFERIGKNGSIDKIVMDIGLEEYV